MKTILVTGGCGFIGSHTCLSLLKNFYNLIVIDSNVNSSPTSLERVKIILNKENIKNPKILYKKDYPLRVYNTHPTDPLICYSLLQLKHL